MNNQDIEDLAVAIGQVIPFDCKEWNDYNEENTMNLDKVHHGFIAQEVKEVLDEYGVADEMDVWSEDADGMQRLAETKLITPLIKAVQELSKEIKELKNKIGE